MDKELTRRGFLKAAGTGAAGIALLGVAGCGGDASSEGADLEFSGFYPSSASESLEQAIQKFQQTHPNINITHQSTPGSGAAVYPDKLRTSMSGGVPPNLFLMWGGTLAGTFIDAEQVQDVGQYYEQYDWNGVLLSTAVQQARRQGQLWGVPVGAHGIGLWFHKDMFSDFNLAEPETYAELEELARTLKSEGITPLAMGGKYGWHVMRFTEYLLEMTAGPEMHDGLNSLEVSWNSPEVIEAFELLKKWADEEWILSGFMGIAPEDSWQPWYQGEAAMVPETDDMAGTLEADGENKAEYDFFVPPTDHEPLRFSSYIHQLMIARNSENHDDSAEFINWYIQPEQMETYFVNSETATVSGLPAEEWPLIDKMQQLLETHETYLITDQALDPELMNSFFSVQSQVISGSVSPQEGAENMQQAVEDWKSANSA